MGCHWLITNNTKYGKCQTPNNTLTTDWRLSAHSQKAMKFRDMMIIVYGSGGYDADKRAYVAMRMSYADLTEERGSGKTLNLKFNKIRHSTQVGCSGSSSGKNPGSAK